MTIAWNKTFYYLQGS